MELRGRSGRGEGKDRRKGKGEGLPAKKFPKGAGLPGQLRAASRKGKGR